MRKVPMNLIGELNKSAEGQVLNVVQAPTPPKVVVPITEYVGCYNVPKGGYMVKLLSAKCDGKYRYELKLEVIEGEFAGKLIKGYADRCPNKYYDLAHCFGNGTIHGTATKYVGGTGKIRWSPSGYIELTNKNHYDPTAIVVKPEGLTEAQKAYYDELLKNPQLLVY